VVSGGEGGRDNIHRGVTVTAPEIFVTWALLVKNMSINCMSSHSKLGRGPILGPYGLLIWAT
jgi:hypothetical protein